MAERGRSLLYQFGVGLAFLGTVRPDSGPRVHPVRVLIAGKELFTFLIPSPKQRDLLRDPRYALHSYPSPHNEDAFYVTGEAHLVEGMPDLRASLARQFIAEMQMEFPMSELDGQYLFEHSVQSCLQTVTKGHGDPHPVHTIWKATTGRT
jgi:hypothetical protein